MPEREQTERVGALESALQQSRDELRDFVRMAAHDVRSALRSVSAHAALLAEKDGPELPADTAQRVGFIVEGVRQLGFLADGMANYAAALEATADASSAVPLETVLRLALGRLDRAIGRAHASVTYDRLPRIPGNMELLARLFENLISNSIRYRREDPPRIHVSAEHRERNWLIAVRDNGQGIEPAYRETIFLPFKRLHGREQAGAGLGLTICRRIAELHGGSIRVEDNPEGGSVFVVSLPATAEMVAQL